MIPDYCRAYKLQPNKLLPRKTVMTTHSYAVQNGHCVNRRPAVTVTRLKFSHHQNNKRQQIGIKATFEMQTCPKPGNMHTQVMTTGSRR